MHDALRNLSVTCVAGGNTRQQSVANGLAAITFTDGLVLIHDAARPGLTTAVIDRLLSAFTDDAVEGAVPALPVADTLARGDLALGETVARDSLWQIQTPQAFLLAAIRGAHAASTRADATDDAQLVRAGGGLVVLVAGDSLLDKVTRSGDLERLERLLSTNTFAPAIRTGLGYDVHRLVLGDGVWLGGILIPHDRKLLGHSDADVALHAITDAILGAIAAGDIGDHFPPGDPQWAGAQSDQFLAHAVNLAGAAGYSITHVDCTIICEAPRIGLHRQAIRNNIAAILGLPLDAISVKATTTEKLGFTGRGEGIAAQAIATVQASR
jgi:2-C-methyl-D-erythritol 4-phosphate cytidylyltransferase / 2-C-methyl-D-erythritol 2,4-cyclodiphosphate synthase